MNLVVWNADSKGADSGWRCMQDICPHRLAPLSEGRVEGGQLHCAYHGWRFDERGACVLVPQIEDAELQARACDSPRSCVKSYPVKVRRGRG